MSAEGPESAPDDGREARRAPVPFFGALLGILACLVLFPAFTVLYQAYEANQIKAYEAAQVAANNHKFCGIVDTLLAPPPPAGPASENPSRAFEQILHAKVADLKAGLGC